MERRSGRRRLIPRWFIIAVLLFAIIPVLSLALNSPAARATIIQRLKSETGLELADVRVRILPRLRIEFSGAVLRDGPQGPLLLQVRQGEVTLRLLPLLRKQIAVSRVQAVQVQILIRRDRAGKWRIPLTDDTQPVPADPSRTGWTWHWVIPDLDMSGGGVTVIDEFNRDTPHELRVTNINVDSQSHLLRKNADVTLTGDIQSAKGPANVRLGGSLWIAISPASSAGRPQRRVSVPPFRFEGAIEMERFEIAPWVNPSAALDEDRQWPTDLAVRVLVTPGIAGYDVDISQLQARLDWLIVQGQGRILGVGGDTPAYSATLSASPVALETVVHQLPDAWIDSRTRTSMNDHELTAVLELVSATVTGRLGRPHAIDWNGVGKISKGTGTFGREKISVRDFSGTVFFDPAHVEVLDLSGNVGPARVSSGSLSLSHLDVAPSLDLQLNGSGKASDLLALLRTEAAQKLTLMANARDVRGEVQLSVHAAGPLTPEPQVELIKAEITAHGLGMHVPALSASVEGLDGTVIVTPRSAEVKRMSGKVGPIQVDAHGAIAIGPGARFEDLVLDLSTEGTALTQAMVAHVSLPSDVVFAGPARGTVRLSGPAQYPRVMGSIDLTEARVVIPPIVKKDGGVPSSLEFNGAMAKSGRLAIRELAFVLPFARVDGRGEIRLRDKPTFAVHLNAGPVAITRLADGFSVGPAKEGVLKASVDITGRGTDWKSWKSSGWVEVTNGIIAAQGLRDPLRRIKLRLHLAGQDAMIERLSFKFGDSDATVRGTIKHWARNPAPTLTLESSKLDLTRLIPETQGEDNGAGMLDHAAAWVGSHQAEVTVLIAQAQYHRLAIKTLSAHLRIGDGTVELDQVSAETAEGTISGRVTAALEPYRPSRLDADLEISGVPVHHIISLVERDADPLRGLLSLNGTVQVTLQHASLALDTLRSTEPVRLRIDEGRIRKGRVIPKVLKVLNVPALLKGEVDFDRNGFPFDHITATVDIADGVLTSNNMVFDSPIMRITGAGRYNMVSDELAAGLAVSPLGSYSDLLKSIPLFGKLLAGDRPGLDTALFEVSGEYKDPEVRYLPFESIGKGLTGFPRLAIDILMNTVTLPQQLLAPSDQTEEREGADK